MIITKFLRVRDDGIKLYKTYSDSNKLIIQSETGVSYEEAIDVEGSKYTYTESEDLIPEEPVAEEE